MTAKSCYIAIVALLALLAPTPSRAEEAPGAPLPYPPGVSMPWRLIGIDANDVQAARSALTESLIPMRNAWLSNPKPLSDVLTARNLTINRKRITDQIAQGQPQTRMATPSVTVEPTWCSLMDRHVFFVTVVDTARNTLLGSAHVSIPKVRWESLAKNRGVFLKGEMPALTRAALAKAANKGGSAATDALHIGLSLAKNVTRVDEGASHCVDMLLEEKLAERYTVARNLGADLLATMRDPLGQPPLLRRPTRGFVLDWTNAPETGPKRTLPVTLSLRARVAETVFGSHIPVTHQSQWEFRIGAGEQIAFAIDPAFETLLSNEKQSLLLADLPQVAKVDRAWVYLDRGRAWGLRMNDRVVADVGGQVVKGHVVRFFGSEAGLTSPRGFPIREGAIVFVRKNQKLSQIGQTFMPDPRAFPTAYPIPPGG